MLLLASGRMDMVEKVLVGTHESIEYEDRRTCAYPSRFLSSFSLSLSRALQSNPTHLTN
jgi:hypothetical protein